MNVDSYFCYADSLAHCGRLSEAFDIYNYISNNVSVYLPPARLKNLYKFLLEHIRRINVEHKILPLSKDPLLCQICSPPDVLRCPVTATCGHSFCKECCEKSGRCPLCDVPFFTCDIGLNLHSVSSLSTSNTTTSTTSSTTTYTFPSTTTTTTTTSVNSFQSTVSSTKEFFLEKQNNSTEKTFMPDILVCSLVDKWWSNDLYARDMNEISKYYMNINLLDEALKYTNDSLEKSPNNINSLLLRSEILYKLKHYQSSLADANKAASFQLSSKVFYQKALSLAALGHIYDAFISLCLVISLDAELAIIKTTEFEKNFIWVLQKLMESFTNHKPADKFEVNTLKLCITKKRKANKQQKFNDLKIDMLKHSRLRKHFKRKEFISDKNITDLNIIDNTVFLWTKHNLKFSDILNKIKEEIQKINNNLSSGNMSEIKDVNADLIDPTDFDCVLCCRTLWKPVVTPCGHTYCWVCLERCMDYSSYCPLCKSTLYKEAIFENIDRVPILINKRPTTIFLEVAMKRYIPFQFENRCRQEINTEPTIPVFTCTTAFPYVPCPLFVYEPRYRLMVRRAIESGDRKFGIIQSQYKGISKLLDVGTMLDIKDCVLLGDGCSILSTIGCRRFKILSRNEKDGYETAKVEYIQDDAILKDNLPKVQHSHNIVLKKATKWFNSLDITIKEEICRSFGTMPSVDEKWHKNSDGPSWSWWIIAILPLNQQLKVTILGTTCFEKRLKAIEKTLDYISRNFDQANSNCVMVRGEEMSDYADSCQNTRSSSSENNRIEQTEYFL